MPIEIKELVIRAVVDPKGESQRPATPAALTGEDREAIVEEAVKKVLHILKASKER